MTEELLDKIIARGFLFAMTVLAGAITIRVVNYALTTNAPWVWVLGRKEQFTDDDSKIGVEGKLVPFDYVANNPGEARLALLSGRQRLVLDLRCCRQFAIHALASSSSSRLYTITSAGINGPNSLAL